MTDFLRLHRAVSLVSVTLLLVPLSAIAEESQEQPAVEWQVEPSDDSGVEESTAGDNETATSEEPPQVAPPAPESTIYPSDVFSLENGLQVVFQVERSSPRVALSLSYAVGERDQPAGYRGLAQLTAILMSNGSRNVESGEFYRRLERAGATEIDSWILADSSTFTVVVPRSQLEIALWLESDRMASMLSRLDEMAFRRARDSLLRDCRESVAQSAVTGLEDVVRGVLYAKNHPYRRLGIDEEDVNEIELEHVQWFFQRYYSPRNARLALVGDFEPSRARELVQRYFGTIRSPESAVRSRRNPQPGGVSGRRRITFGALTTARTVRMIWATPPYLAPGDAELDFLAYALGYGRRSRLHRRLVLDMSQASTVYAWQQSRQLGSSFRVQVQMTSGGDFDAVVTAIEEEVARLCEEPLEQSEIERIRTMNRIRELVDSEGLSQRAQMMSRIVSPLAEDGVFRVEENLERYNRVTAETLQEAACRYLGQTHRLVVIVTPNAEASDEGMVVSDEVMP